MPIYDTVEQLRADIARKLEAEGREHYDAQVRQLAAEQAAERFEGSIPDAAYEAMRDQLMAQYRQQVQQQGRSWEDFMQEAGGEQQFSMLMMMQVRQMLVIGFALDAIFRHEKLTLTDEDILETCYAMNPQANPKALREQMEQSGRGFALRESAERLKANKWLVETADITYADPTMPTVDPAAIAAAANAVNAASADAAANN